MPSCTVCCAGGRQGLVLPLHPGLRLPGSPVPQLLPVWVPPGTHTQCPTRLYSLSHNAIMFGYGIQPGIASLINFLGRDCENQLTFAKDTGQGIVPILVDSGFPQAMQSPAIPIQASEAMELPEKVLATRLEECHQENARLRQELIAKEKELSTADTQHEASGVAPGDARERDNAGRKLPLKCCDQQASKCCSIS